MGAGSIWSAGAPDSPTVILEAGFRTRADVWSDDLVQPEAPRTMVFPGVAAFTRVCAYDRPGTATVRDDGLHPSRSDPVTMPRTARASVGDLHALLIAAQIPAPYVLVGHSYGGMLLRLYASTYPDEVAGMVLVDAFSEGLEDQMSPEPVERLRGDLSTGARGAGRLRGSGIHRPVGECGPGAYSDRGFAVGTAPPRRALPGTGDGDAGGVARWVDR